MKLRYAKLRYAKLRNAKPRNAKPRNAWMAALGLLLSACASSASSSSAPIDWGRPPPSRPGSSITHTQLCACTACSERACCRGPDETQAECDAASAPETLEGEDPVVDFSGAEDCGVEVRSCSTSCTRKVWRVPSTEGCEHGRPADCCE